MAFFIFINPARSSGGRNPEPGDSKLKSGMTLTDLAAEIVRRSEAKVDLVADTRNVSLDADGRLHVGDREFGVNAIAHQQIATHADIPAKYYERMRAEAPDLLANNVNR